MRRLVRVELTRFRWRRAILALLLLSIVIPMLIGAARVWDTRPLSESEKTSFEQRKSEQVAQCVEHPRQWGVRSSDPDRIQARCDRMMTGWQFERRPLSLAHERDGGSGMGVVAVLTALLLLAATTFVGHDWNSGSMSNQLLFEARRGRIWAAKALTVTGVAFVLAAVVSTAYWLGMWAVMRIRDLTVLDGSLTNSLAYGLRGAGFAAATALGAYALTMLCRSTVATIGVLFGVSLAGGIIISALGLGEQWQPHKNVAAIVKDGTTYWVQPPISCEGKLITADDEECTGERVLGLWQGVGYYGVPLAAVAGASVLSFRRRDVP